jgi:chromosome partitioning protein
VGNPDPTHAESAIYPVTERLSLLPCTIDLAGAEPVLLGAVGKEQILAEILTPLKDQFDVILVDSPPSLGLLTINILAAADAVLIPMQCEYYALEGLSQLLRSISLVSKRINPKLQVRAVILTMYDPRNRLTQQVEEDVRNYFGAKVCQTVIPRNIRLSEAPSFGESAVTRFPSAKGSEAYIQLAEELAP